MPNPLNPLDWLRSAQDWFAKTERSSGFRPYLIFFIIVCGLSLSLLFGFSQIYEVRIAALSILIMSSFAFILLFAIKSFQEPDFCRSETHLRSMKKLELEYMGSESEAVPGEIIEEQIAIETPLEPKQISAEAETDIQ